MPFRDRVLEYGGHTKTVGESDENLLTCLSELFVQVSSWFLPTFDYLHCVDDYKFDGGFIAFPELLRNNKISSNALLSCLKNA